MKSKVIFLSLFVFLFSACSKDEVMIENKPVVIKENFGPRSFSWVNPYSSAKSVVFESQNGDVEVFDISISDIEARGNAFSDAIGQYRNFTFVSKNNSEKRFVISPLGNSALYFFAAPINHPFNPELFKMIFSPYVGARTFMINLTSKNTDVLNFNYSYSTSYPNGTDEEIEVFFDEKSNDLFSSIKLQQGVGLVTYRDKNQKLWTQREIK